ncbi:MAG: hypothetical protein RLZZ387_498 [Chloroflexota bacterium]
MIAQSSRHPPVAHELRPSDWLRLAVGAAVLSAAAVLITQLTALAIWPELIAFDPLNSLPRSILFTVIPAFAATGVFAWLDRHVARPGRAFLLVAAIVLMISIVPDYLLPFANKTLLASTVTAALHVVAGIVTVSMLLTGYRSARQIT